VTLKRWFAVAVIAGATIAALGSFDLQRQREFVVRATAQPASPSGPAQMLPELDNESVLVVRIRMAPHERTGMHDVSARLVVWLTDAHMRDTKADGAMNDYTRTAGTIEWVQAQRHAGENRSDTPIEFLAIIPKSAPSASR
jgi:hypothetical protein